MTGGCSLPGTFEIAAESARARRGLLYTSSGPFETPAFMPVGTQGSVKGVSPAELEGLGAQILLTNTYHLHLRPGEEIIRGLGGIHRFMGWPGPILSDSGGYQVFSLSKLRQVSRDGVRFQSHLDGSEVMFTPERVVAIQETLGVDIMMVLDECLPPEAGREEAVRSWELSFNWARRSKGVRTRPDILLFGIVQGGMFPDLRQQVCRELVDEGFDGYAVGGVSVGEPIALMREITDASCSVLPAAKIRYLMGVGTPLDIVESVELGVDMFDCVIPTRSARFGRLYCGSSWINIKNALFRTDSGPIEESCDCYACRNFSRAYISHLIHAKEMLGVQLASLHNLRFYQRLMQDIRSQISDGTFPQFAERFRSGWRRGAEFESAEARANDEP